jgi:hypothetical protein
VLIKKEAKIRVLKKLNLVIMLKILRERKIKEFKGVSKDCLYGAGYLRGAGFFKRISV